MIKKQIFFLFMLFFSTLNVFAIDADTFSVRVDNSYQGDSKIRVIFIVPDYLKLIDVSYRMKTLDEYERDPDAANNDLFLPTSIQANPNGTYYIYLNKYKLKAQTYILELEIITKHFHFNEWETNISRSRTHYALFKIESIPKD